MNKAKNLSFGYVAVAQCILKILLCVQKILDAEHFACYNLNEYKNIHSDCSKLIHVV
jgi:hypothetical protein